MILRRLKRTCRRKVTALAALAGVLTALGEAEVAVAQGSKSAARPSAPPPRSARAVVIERATPGGKRQLDVVLELTGTRAGAYQATLNFRPGALTAIEARSRAGDGTRLVNPADSARGVIKFAGYTVTPTGFSDSVMVSLTANVVGSLTQAGLSVTLEAVGGADGNPLTKAQILPFGGVRRAP
jgi:hypothetical protein